MYKILIVEDDAPTRRQLARILDTLGYHVKTAAHANAALRHVEDNAIDLLLVDIWMPGMSGTDLLAEVRSRGIGAKAIVMTSDETSETMLTAVREQAYDYLLKPINASVLREKVKDALASNESGPIKVVSAARNWVELVVPCQLDIADRLQSFLAVLDADLSEELRESVARVFREMLLNAIEWGGGLDPRRSVRVAYVRADKMLMYRIADPGPGFELGDLSHAAVGHPADRPADHMKVRSEKGLRPGGFGILLSQEMVDELIYNEARNEVLFVKYIDNDPDG